MKQFRNLKSGNVLCVSDENTIRIMEQSDNYEEVIVTAPEPEVKKPAKKPATKKTE